MTESDWIALKLTLQLASIVTFILLVGVTPLAWWLAHTRCRVAAIVHAIVSLPLVLPPTVLGFYLLVLLQPHGVIGSILLDMGLGSLPFTFSGLVLASVLYSLPFVVQPLHNTFVALGERPLEVASTLRAKPWDRFVTIVLPLSVPGYVSAAVMGFAHTVGEFGVVLMIGGNIPGRTQVLSVQLYNHVEAFEYGQAHWLSGGLLGFSFMALWVLYRIFPPSRQKGFT